MLSIPTGFGALRLGVSKNGVTVGAKIPVCPGVRIGGNVRVGKDGAKLGVDVNVHSIAEASADVKVTSELVPSASVGVKGKIGDIGKAGLKVEFEKTGVSGTLSGELGEGNQSLGAELCGKTNGKITGKLSSATNNIEVDLRDERKSAADEKKAPANGEKPSNIGCTKASGSMKAKDTTATQDGESVGPKRMTYLEENRTKRALRDEAKKTDENVYDSESEEEMSLDGVVDIQDGIVRFYKCQHVYK